MEKILHAIDETMLGSWDEAIVQLKAVDDTRTSALAARLLELVDQLEQEELVRNEQHARLGHEIGNTLAVAQATLEGMLDGVVDRDDINLEKVHDAVRVAGAVLAESGRERRDVAAATTIVLETFTLCSMIDEELAAAAVIAAPKDIRLRRDGTGPAACAAYRGNPVRTRRLLHDVLISVVRSTPPGSTVELHHEPPDGMLVVTVRNDNAPGHPVRRMSLAAVARLLHHLNDRVRVASVESSSLRLHVPLPAASI
ncbi:HAMP domain-containing histidine kinase [bacterium]|nr:MAG: HAMP domain-containing histidine kinase [bacterium]